VAEAQEAAAVGASEGAEARALEAATVVGPGWRTYGGHEPGDVTVRPGLVRIRRWWSPVRV
jgi:hypothetical protein